MSAPPRNYTPVSPRPDRTCGGCVFYAPRGPEVGQCHGLDAAPDPQPEVSRLGVCSRYSPRS